MGQPNILVALEQVHFITTSHNKDRKLKPVVDRVGL